MKKAIFVTNRKMEKKQLSNPWMTQAPYNSREIDLPAGEGLMLFRREFDLPDGADASKIRIRATALGIFDLFLDGERVGTPLSDGTIRYEELKPEWTDYRYRVMEYEYDLTPYCQGKTHHTILAAVSDGWWSGRIAFGTYKDLPGAFCAELEIDGKVALATGTPGWMTAIGGRVRTADIWDGEYFDARMPDPTTQPEGYEWIDATAFDGFHGEIIPLVGSPLRERRGLTRTPVTAVRHLGTEDDGSELGTIHILEKYTGEACDGIVLHAGERLILDMGQNMVGLPRMTVHGAARGVKISLYTAEFLNDSGESSRGNDGPSGSMYLKNYRHALSRAVYVSAGTERVTYQPSHTYYGFRYIEIVADGDLVLDELRGVVVGSDMKETGWIETDNAEVNQLFSNIVWGMRGNYFSNPTDCPQRDERLGWTGDTQVFCGAGAYLANTRDFMRKWLGDVRASQHAAGGKVCDVIPAVLPGYNNTAWGDAAIVVPYRMWLMFRDEALLAEHYDAMEDYMASLEENGLDGANLAYGDWLAYEQTDKRYIAICYYAYDAALMERMSNILVRSETKYQDRVLYYHRLREKITAHFRERYMKDGELTMPTQTGYLLALRFGLVTGKERENCKQLLRRKIVENGYRLSTGFIGTGILNQTLDELDMNDLAYSLLLQTEDPSWLYSVRQGATTVWERWNSYTIDRGFGDVGMNSFNHYAYGVVAEWMFAAMAGIRPDETRPGFVDHFVLSPKPDTRRGAALPAGQTPIRRVSAHLDIAKGRIESGWEIGEDEKLICRFVIPAGTSAAVTVPVTSDKLTVNGKECDAASLGAAVDASGWHFELGEGKYIVQ